MGWPTNYTGPQIDETLEKGRNLKIVSNGCIQLESTESSPIILRNLKNPGNYVTSYWTDGPEIEEVVSHLNINVILINNIIHQFVTCLGYTYSRIVYSDDTVTEWIDQSSGFLSVGISEPESIDDGKTLWLDISDVSEPILKLYIDGEWKEVASSSIMKCSIYDPTGKKTDIFQYIKDSISEISTNSGSFDFENHINNEDIHVTILEKQKWDNSPTIDSLNDQILEIKSGINDDISNGFESDITKFETLGQAITEASEAFVSHIDASEHPDSTKRKEWDGKADINHQHNQDNNVTISTHNIIGIIPLDKLGYDVIERAYSATSESEIYSKLKNPTHNGDVFYIENPDGNVWYFVINDSYLGTDESSKAFKKLYSTINIIWKNISNLPTTISGYNIKDAANKESVLNIQNKIIGVRDVFPNTDKANVDAIVAAETARNEANNILYTFKLLDEAIIKLSSISE